jgi:hypothetical protein
VEAPAVEAPADEGRGEDPGADEAPAEEPADDEPAVVHAPLHAAGAPDGSASLDREHAQAILDEVLDALGSAHHRPFSRG